MPHLRYYCPRCGAVTCAIERYGNLVVKPHYHGPQGRRETCLGGTVDRKEDRAP